MLAHQQPYAENHHHQKNYYQEKNSNHVFAVSWFYLPLLLILLLLLMLKVLFIQEIGNTNHFFLYLCIHRFIKISSSEIFSFHFFYFIIIIYFLAKFNNIGILFSASPISVLRTAVVTKPIMSGSLFSTSPHFSSMSCLSVLHWFELN